MSGGKITLDEIYEIEKTRGFEYKKPDSAKIKVKIPELFPIPFEQNYLLQERYTGYIRRDGAFYPGIRVESTYGGKDILVSMAQYGDALFNLVVKNEKMREEYDIAKNSSDANFGYRGTISTPDSFFVEKLGYCKFDGYDPNFDAFLKDDSLIPKDATARQLFVFQQLLLLNYGSNYGLNRTMVDVSKKLTEKIKRLKI